MIHHPALWIAALLLVSATSASAEGEYADPRTLFRAAADAVHGQLIEDASPLDLPDGRRAWSALIEIRFLGFAEWDTATTVGSATGEVHVERLPVWAVEPASDPPDPFRPPVEPRLQQHGPVHWPFHHLGAGHGRDWYGRVPFHVSRRLHETLELVGGEDPVAAAIAQLAVADPDSATAHRSAEVFIRAGEDALPALRHAVENGLPGRELAIPLLRYDLPPRAVPRLVEWCRSTDRPVAEAARYTLLAAPQKRASSLYVRWLQQGEIEPDYVLPLLWKGGVALDEVQALLDEGFAKYKYRQETLLGLIERGFVAPAQARAVLEPVLEWPDTLAHYRRSYLLQRELAGQPVDATAWEIGQILWQYGQRPDGGDDPDALAQGLHFLGHSKDMESRALLGILMAAAAIPSATTPEDNPDSPPKARRIGHVILNSVDRRITLRLLRPLAAGVQDPAEKTRVNALLQHVEASR